MEATVLGIDEYAKIARSMRKLEESVISGRTVFWTQERMKAEGMPFGMIALAIAAGHYDYNGTRYVFVPKSKPFVPDFSKTEAVANAH